MVLAVATFAVSTVCAAAEADRFRPGMMSVLGEQGGMSTTLVTDPVFRSTLDWAPRASSVAAPLTMTFASAPMLGIGAPAFGVASGLDETFAALLPSLVGAGADMGDNDAGLLEDATTTPGPLGSGCPGGRLERRLQGATGFWTPQAASISPVHVDLNARSDAALGRAPTAAASRDASDMDDADNFRPLRAGAASGWCRPQPMPFSVSSPLASRGFLAILGVLISIAVVFGLSRGFKMPEL